MAQNWTAQQLGVQAMLKAYFQRNNLSHDEVDLNNITSIDNFMIEFIYTTRQIQNGRKFSIVIIVISAVMLFFQLTTLPIFVIHRNYRKNQCFRILFSNGCIDSLQLATLFIFAILNLFLADIKPIQRIGGAIGMPAWYIVLVQHVLLAYNRLIVIMRARLLGTSQKWLKILLAPERETETIIFNIAHVICWTAYLAMFGLFLSPYVGAVLNRGTMVFLFDHTRPYTQLFENVIWGVTFLLPFLCFFIYGVIIRTAKKSRVSMQQNADDRVAAGPAAGQKSNKSQPLLNDYERRLLIQALILYTVMAFLIFCYSGIHYCDVNHQESICYGYIPFTEVKLFKIPLYWYTIIVLIPYTINCGLSPILFLVMNKEFRTRYTQLYTRKSPEELSEILTTTMTLVDCRTDGARKRRNNAHQDGSTNTTQRKAISHDPKGNKQMEEKEAWEAKRKMTT